MEHGDMADRLPPAYHQVLEHGQDSVFLLNSGILPRLLQLIGATAICFMQPAERAVKRPLG